MAAVKILILLVLLLLTNAVLADEIKEIRINGLEYSDARVVLRELPFKAGDSWQPEFAEDGERRLRNLGLFSEATILPPDDNGVVNVTVNDKWPFWLLPEGSRSDRGSTTAGFAMTYHNVWGLNHMFRLATRWDTGKNFTSNNGNSYQGSYYWRRINDSKFSFNVDYRGGRSLYDAYQNGLLTSNYTLEQRSWSGSLGYGFGPTPGEGWDVWLGFSSSTSNYLLNTGPLLPNVKGLRRQGVQFNTSYRFVNDHVTWLTGYLFDYGVSVSHQFFGSEINSYRQQLSLRRHLDIGNQNTLSFRINAGLATGEVLLDGLFDVGSGTDIRGYYPGELQGDAYIYGTLEGRFPLEVNSNFQFVAFVDAGHVSLGGSSALNESVVAGIGAGMRWTLRWLVDGTFRLDGAYGTATKRWRAHLAVGQAF